MYGEGCDTGVVSYISGIAMDKFQYTWVVMIGEMYKVDCWIFKKWL